MPEKKEKQTNDLLEIKGKLNEIHKDMKRFIEQSNQQHLDTVLSGSRSHFTNAIIGHVIGDIDEDLESNMVKKCEMRETCKLNFTGFLQNNAGLMKNDNVHQDVILKNQSDLNGMRSNAPSKQCEKCFSNVQALFGKQVDLMRSLQIYNTDKEKKQDLSVLPEELIVNNILEPISNKQRLQILKAIAIETKTFSALSELTGLRGGNLLFHVQKLLDSGMILQRHERGDYMITDKGFKVLRSIGDMYSMLNS
jgi:predicted transcriptional regulator